MGYLMFVYAVVICCWRKHGSETWSLEFTQQEKEKFYSLITWANQYNIKTKMQITVVFLPDDS